MNCLGEKRGSVLVLSLWVVAALSAAVLSLTYYSSMQLKTLDRRTQAVKADIAFLAGTEWVRALYSADSDPTSDDPTDAWLGGVLPPQKRNESLRVDAVDEESKLDLNRDSLVAISFVLNKLKTEQKVSLDPEVFTKTIGEYRQKKGIEYLEELGVIAGLSHEDVVTLKDFFTVFGRGAVNINTASDVVLEAVVEAYSGAKDPFLKGRLENLILEARKNKKYFSARDMEVSLFLRKIHMQETPDTNSAASRTLKHLTTDSKSVLLRMEYGSAFRGTALMQPTGSGSGSPLIVKYWHEERIGRAL